jgi:uncharacterized membrane protein
MKFSYSAVWNEAVDLVRANAAVLVALAGVFFFLPDLAFLHFFPPPQPGGGVDPNTALQLVIEYYQACLPWLMLEFLLRMIGTISMLLVLLGPRTTVGGAIASSLMILPFYFLASLISGFMVLAGLLLLIVPGLYLSGRLAMIGPVVAAEGERNPIAAITRSLALTRGNGWAVLGLFILILLTGYILVAVAGWILGAIFMFVAGKDIGTFLALIVQTLGGAALATVLVALMASLYRAFQGAPASAA